jgi:hypothetical protein
MGWFYGLKLHLIINSKAQIMAAQITLGNTNDTKALGYMIKDLRHDEGATMLGYHISGKPLDVQPLAIFSHFPFFRGDSI